MNGNKRRRETGHSKAANCWKMTKSFFEQIHRQIMEREWSPRLIATLLCLLFSVFMLLFIIYLILSSLFFSSSKSFLLYPPVCEECLKRNPGASTYRPPSQLYVQISSPAQAHFELIGNQPFKSNSFTAVDFHTGYIAIADHALTDEHGKHTHCFLMQLDRNALPDMSSLQYALGNTYHEVRTQFGWQEYWQYNVEPVDPSFVNGKFKDDIEDCRGAKWFFLKHSVYTKDSSCSECYDFCLPDYAIQRRQKYEDDITLGIRRLNCFRLYVGEWSRFQISADESGGHWQYPKHSMRQTQKDANGNWIDWNAQQDQNQRPHNPQLDRFDRQ